MKGKYDEKCDIWSCGVILYILLSGTPPFAGDDDREIMANASKGKIVFDSCFDASSEEAKSLILEMCNTKASKRLSAEQALNTEWVKQPQKVIRSDSKDEKTASEYLKRMKGFSVMNRLKKTALQVIAHHLDDKVVKNLREQFTLMDENGDGKLTLGEMQKAFNQVGGLNTID